MVISWGQLGLELGCKVMIVNYCLRVVHLYLVGLTCNNKFCWFAIAWNSTWNSFINDSVTLVTWSVGPLESFEFMIGDLSADIDWGFSTETGLGFFFGTLTGSSFLDVSDKFSSGKRTSSIFLFFDVPTSADLRILDIFSAFVYDILGLIGCRLR